MNNKPNFIIEQFTDNSIVCRKVKAKRLTDKQFTELSNNIANNVHFAILSIANYSEYNFTQKVYLALKPKTKTIIYLKEFYN